MKFERLAGWRKIPRCAAIMRQFGDKVSMTSRQCRDDAHYVVNGEPRCKRHAQEQALSYLLDGEAKAEAAE